MRLLDRLGEALRILQIRMRRLPPQQIGITRIGQAARDAVIQTRARLQSIKALWRAVLAVDERMIPFVDVGGDQLRAFGVRAGHRQRRRATDIGRQARGDQIALMRLGRDQHLAAQVPALLLGGQLVLEVHAGGARLDKGLHDLEAVQGAAETGLRIRHDGGEPVALGAPLRMLDLVCALKRAVDAPTKLGGGVRRIQGLVRIHGARRIGVGRHLPARQIDGLQARPDHLHGLVSGHGAQCIDEGFGVQQLPQAVCAALRQSVGDRNRAAKPQHVLGRIWPLDPVEAARRRGHEVGECGHGRLLAGRSVVASLEENTPLSQPIQHPSAIKGHQASS